jgi:hypothetical protein
MLAALAETPDMSAETLSGVIVDSYVDHYITHPTPVPITQAAVRTEYVPSLVGAIGQLADSLVSALDNHRFYADTLLPVMRDVQKFRDQQYVDVWHLGHLLATQAAHEPVREHAQAVAAWLDPASPTSAIVAARALGAHGTMLAAPYAPTRGLAREPEGEGQAGIIARGLSIYVPFLGAVSPAYAELEFARQCTWDKFLQVFVES